MTKHATKKAAPAKAEAAPKQVAAKMPVVETPSAPMPAPEEQKKSTRPEPFRDPNQPR